MMLKTAKAAAGASPRQRALNWLARREYAARELVARLERIGFEPDAAEQTVASLAAEGLQSDERYAEILVRSRYRQGHGPVRIRAELERWGIDDSLIRRHLRCEDHDWFAAAAAAAEQRTHGRAPADRREEAKLYQFLGRRGFEPDQVREAIAALKRKP